jgi:hypothetical protein
MSLSTDKRKEEFLNRIGEIEKGERRRVLLELGVIIECTATAKKAGITIPVAMTKHLWNELYPHAEDAAKGVTFEEVLWDIFKLYKKEVVSNKKAKGYMEFAILAKTHVKKYHSPDKIETFSNGESRTKRVEIMVTFLPDNSLLFGRKAVKWLS